VDEDSSPGKGERGGKIVIAEEKKEKEPRILSTASLRGGAGCKERRGGTAYSVLSKIESVQRGKVR